MPESEPLSSVQPPANTADRERFWREVERAAQERDDQVNEVIFPEFYVADFYPEGF